MATELEPPLTATKPHLPSMTFSARLARSYHVLVPAVIVLLFGIALTLIYKQLSQYHYSDIRDGVKAIPTPSLLLAMAVTAISYAFLVTYDGLALYYLKKHIKPLKVALVSFAAYVCNYNLGLAGIGGTAVRVRYYSAEKLNGWDIAQVVSFCAVTFWLGLFALAGTVLLFGNIQLPSNLGGDKLGTGAGIALIAFPIAYIVLLSIRDEPLKIWRWTLDLPSVPIGLTQIFIAIVDNMLAAAVLWILLPPSELGYFGVLGIFMVAAVVGLISHVPGGIGIFEAVVLALMPIGDNGSAVIASLLLFRLVYYIMPLLVGVILVAFYELSLRRGNALSNATKIASKALPTVVPPVLAVVTFISGVVLLLSGATPIDRGRLDILGSILPLPLIETSHFLNSLIGVLLLIIARGIQRRLDSAWYITVTLLIVGIGVSLTKGLDWEEATTLAFILMILLPCKSYFYRKSSLMSQSLTSTWLAAIGVSLLASTWLGLFVFRHVEYSEQMWWQFTVSGDAPRFIRAMAGATVLLIIISLLRLFASGSLPKTHAVTAEDMSNAQRIIAKSPDTAAQLALLGDKRFLFSDSGESFVMYAIVGRTWIAMGDPVGSAAEREPLIWKFLNLCDLHSGRACFYQVSAESLADYIECGLSLTKLGEEARVFLPDFSMLGSDRGDFRTRLRKAEKEGLSMDIVASQDVSSILSELRAVSNAWMTLKDGKEKGFSLGFFDDHYLAENPVAVVRCEGRIVAFANLWLGANKSELSIDLMRYSDTAPKAVMEYLFLELILFGQKQGYQWFGLGMAPLSGIESTSSSPLWHRVADTVYERGERLYGFQGLRGWKNKFDPVWQPRYLASRSGIALPLVLGDVIRLISLKTPKPRTFGPASPSLTPTDSPQAQITQT